MSLAELFYRKHPRLPENALRRRRERMRRRPFFEPLEPRLLLSGDPLTAALSNGVLTLTLDADTPDVRIEHLSTNADGSEVVDVQAGDWRQLFGVGDDGGVTDLVIRGSAGDDRIDLTGVWSSATITGGEGDDTLIGGFGDDTIVGGAGDDRLEGGEGWDTYAFAAGTTLGHDTLVDTNGIDTLDFSASTVGVTVDLLADLVVDSADLTLALGSRTVIENLVGGAGADTLSGDDGGNVLVGNGGDDTLRGSGGDDLYLFDADLVLGADTIDEAVDGGLETLDFS